MQRQDASSENGLQKLLLLFSLSSLSAETRCFLVQMLLHEGEAATGPLWLVLPLEGCRDLEPLHNGISVSVDDLPGSLFTAIEVRGAQGHWTPLVTACHTHLASFDVDRIGQVAAHPHGQRFDGLICRKGRLTLHE